MYIWYKVLLFGDAQIFCYDREVSRRHWSDNE